MSRYIDAEVLKSKIATCITVESRGKNIYENLVRFVLETVRDVIDAQPTVDAKPVLHGKWIVTNEGVIKCSECKRKFILLKENYCPNCGARMDAEDDKWI